MIGALAITFHRGFLSKSHDYWPHIITGLTLIQQPKVFKVALCAAGDFSRVYG